MNADNKPAITPDQIAHLLEHAEIVTQTIFEKVTLVAVRLPNGFVLTESSGAVSKENYSESVGREICLRKIDSELWKLEGYALQKQLASAPSANSAVYPAEA